MPATVGTTLPSPAQFPLRHAGLGPFISSDGTVYFLGRRSTFTGQMGMFRTTDPMAGTWTEVAINPGIASTIEAAAAYQVGDTVHSAFQFTTGVDYYAQYSMINNNWPIAETAQSAAATTFAPTANAPFVSLVVRSNGNVVLGYAGGVTVMSGALNTVYYRERTGVNTYGTATASRR